MQKFNYYPIKYRFTEPMIKTLVQQVKWTLMLANAVEFNNAGWHVVEYLAEKDHEIILWDSPAVDHIVWGETP